MTPTRSLRAAALIALALGTGCPIAPHPQMVPDATLSELPRKPMDGSEMRIDLLARQLLVRGSPVPSGYAYHCYLLFADSSAEGEGARRAAATAYLRLLRDVTEVGAIVRPQNMAVLFAPVRDRGSASEVLKTRDVALFLRDYDYDSARLLVNSLRRAGKSIPSVAIVGSRLPLQADERAAKGGGAPVSIVDLDVPDETEIERRVLRLRDELEAGKTEVSQRGEVAVLSRLRAFFRLVGSVGEDLESGAGRGT